MLFESVDASACSVLLYIRVNWSNISSKDRQVSSGDRRVIAALTPRGLIIWLKCSSVRGVEYLSHVDAVEPACTKLSIIMGRRQFSHTP